MPIRDVMKIDLVQSIDIMFQTYYYAVKHIFDSQFLRNRNFHNMIGSETKAGIMITS